MELVAAVKKRLVQKALQLIQAGVDVNAAGARGETALLWAVIHGESEIVSALLTAGANPTPRTRGKRAPGNSAARATPLHFATNPERVDILKQLLAAGAELEAEDAVGMTPLAAAAAAGQADAVRLLLSAGANPDHGNPLLMAAKNGYVEIVSDLLSAGAQHTPADTLPYPPLRLALAGGHHEVATLLRSAGARWQGR